MANEWKWLAVAATLCACGDASRGDVSVVLSAEASITDGLAAGSAEEDIQDGWQVRFRRYVVAIGDVTLARSSRDDEPVRDDTVVLADLASVGEAGRALTLLTDLEAGQWDKLSYATPAADAEVQRLDGVPEAIAEEMIAQGWTYYIEAELEKDDQRVELVLGAEAATRFEDCELDGQPGVSVAAGTTRAAALTIHGDHLFFNAFPTGSEGSVERRAQWVANADADGDGTVTTEELSELAATDVFTSDDGYRLDGVPDGIRIESALDFVRAQLATQGHYQGEGECVWLYQGVEGEEHEHHEEN